KLARSLGDFERTQVCTAPFAALPQRSAGQVNGPGALHPFTILECDFQRRRKPRSGGILDYQQITSGLGDGGDVITEPVAWLRSPTGKHWKRFSTVQIELQRAARSGGDFTRAERDGWKFLYHLRSFWWKVSLLDQQQLPPIK